MCAWEMPSVNVSKFAERGQKYALSLNALELPFFLKLITVAHHLLLHSVEEISVA